MRLRLLNKSFVLWFAAFALLGVRTAEAHIHLCLDGQSPSAALHAWDSEASCHDGETYEDEAHGGEHDGEHNDTDVAAQGVVVAKSSDTQVFGPLPVDVILLFLLPPEHSSSDFFVATPSVFPQRPYLFQPHLRGPPV